MLLNALSYPYVLIVLKMALIFLKASICALQIILGFVSSVALNVELSLFYLLFYFYLFFLIIQGLCSVRMFLLLVFSYCFHMNRFRLMILARIVHKCYYIFLTFSINKSIILGCPIIDDTSLTTKSFNYKEPFFSF